MYNKKFFLSLIILGQILFGANFDDMNFLINKYRIKITVQELEKLKNMYEPGSHEYNLLQQTENYFLSKFPVDSFGIYSRIKLHNVIENAENRLQEYYKKQAEKQQEKVLDSHIDLEELYLRKQEELAELKKREAERQKLKQKKKMSPQEEYMNILKQFIPK